jgi:hypothetical protein
MLTTFVDMVMFLDRQPTLMRAEPEKDRVVVSTAGRGLPGEMAILWDQQNTLVQCLYPLPFQIPVERMSAMDEAVTRINHALVLPGLGVDHGSRLVYCRVVAPRRDDGSLSEAEFERLVATTLQTSLDLYQALQEVANGSVSAEDALGRATELKNPKSNGTPRAVEHNSGGEHA